MKIKMIGLDLDGTVLNQEKKMGIRTRQAVEEAIKRGVMVLPATGRPLSGIPDEIFKIHGIQYALCANGAVIHDLKKQKKIHEVVMDYKEIMEIIERLKKIDVMADVFIDGRGYVETENLAYHIQFETSAPLREYILKTRTTVENLSVFLKERQQNIQKMTINFRREEDGSLYGKEGVEKILSEYKELAVVSGMATNLEVTNARATKGNGLLILGELFGIKKEEIMACGDSGNDREMLKAVGLGVAMENSTNEVLEIADYITKSNEEDGVAHAIEKFVLQP
ncbi:MAG: Cof-type HAD-IIB family hydrolase [Acetivibrio sp.]